MTENLRNMFLNHFKPIRFLLINCPGNEHVGKIRSMLKSTKMPFSDPGELQYEPFGKFCSFLSQRICEIISQELHMRKGKEFYRLCMEQKFHPTKGKRSVPFPENPFVNDSTKFYSFTTKHTKVGEYSTKGLLSIWAQSTPSRACELIFPKMAKHVSQKHYPRINIDTLMDKYDLLVLPGVELEKISGNLIPAARYMLDSTICNSWWRCRYSLDTNVNLETINWKWLWKGSKMENLHLVNKPREEVTGDNESDCGDFPNFVHYEQRNMNRVGKVVHNLGDGVLGALISVFVIKGVEVKMMS